LFPLATLTEEPNSWEKYGEKNAIHSALSARNSDPDHHFDRAVQPLLIAIGTIATPDLGV
jgi:hypothetical protein